MAYERVFPSIVWYCIYGMYFTITSKPHAIDMDRS